MINLGHRAAEHDLEAPSELRRCGQAKMCTLQPRAATILLPARAAARRACPRTSVGRNTEPGTSVGGPPKGARRATGEGVTGGSGELGAGGGGWGRGAGRGN